MQLGIIPEQGGSIAGLRRGGQDRRFIEQYLSVYTREFQQVYYFSYARESLDLPDADNFRLRRNPGFHRWLYTFLMPLIQARPFRRCSVMRVMQATGTIPAYMARLLYGTPFVVTYGYHYSTELRAAGRRLRAWLFDRRTAWALRHADGIIVTTPVLAEFAKRFAPRERIALIPNSVDTEVFSPPSESPSSGEGTWGGASDRHRLIAIGNLTANKNHRLILEAMALTGGNDLELVVVGTGPEQQALSQVAAEKGLVVHLAGTVPNERLPQLLRQSDLYVISSLSEGQPKSLLEAMSVGLPCIGTNVRGIRDVLTDGETGWLCAATADALAATIQAALSNKERAREVGMRARRYILDHHDARVVMAREIAFLKEVAHRRGR